MPPGWVGGVADTSLAGPRTLPGALPAVGTHRSGRVPVLDFFASELIQDRDTNGWDGGWVACAL